MFRFIIICIIVIGYLILSIPILFGEWILGKFDMRKKGYQLSADHPGSIPADPESYRRGHHHHRP